MDRFPLDAEACRQLAWRVRRTVLEMVYRARSSHVGSAFSIAEILAVLYGRALKVDPQHPAAPERDRLILSKGHACSALYAVLAERGFFPGEWLETFYTDGAALMGHASHKGVPGVEVSTGSLGHGLPLGCGMALAGKRDGRGYRAFAVMSDGECDEGSNWEAALLAAHHRLDNLVAVVDYNKIQSMAPVRDTIGLEPLADKWRSFGWETREVDGHDVAALSRVLEAIPLATGKPTCLVAHTVKGKGVSFMENSVLWHYRAPNDEEMARARAELEAQR